MKTLDSIDIRPFLLETKNRSEEYRKTHLNGTLESPSLDM